VHGVDVADLLSPDVMSKPFATAWLNEEQGALALLPALARTLPARAAAVRIAAQKTMDSELLTVLVAQNSELPPSPARDRHLQLLAQPGTVVVATGQQVGLFLGPLYTLYKAASSIVAARQLTAETGVACVPLFWMPTEDHDFAEIDHCFVPRRGEGPGQIALTPSEPSHVPIAHRLLPDDVADALAAFADDLAHASHVAEVVALLRHNYVPGMPIARAFAQTLAAIFAAEGLVFFDPHTPDVAPFAAPFHRQCLVQAHDIADEILVRAGCVREAGFEPQVHIRPGAPLSFVAPDAMAGPRYRLEPAKQGVNWLLVGHPQRAQVTTAQLLDWLDREPQRFSTSALSRPLLQDTLLPTVAYVGGPGEVAYFAQLAPLYPRFGLPVPLVLLRDRFLLTDLRMQAFLRDRGLVPADLAKPQEDLLQYLAPHGAPDQRERLAQMLAALQLDALGRELTALDPNLAKTATRAHDAIADILLKLLNKQARARVQRDHAQVEKLERARNWLMPNGEPQERVYGVAAMMARFGIDDLKQAVLHACRPFAAELQELPL
jgi:bacillithiol biosynthesis cysteine-adding enzyme BshC